MRNQTPEWASDPHPPLNDETNPSFFENPSKTREIKKNVFSTWKIGRLTRIFRNIIAEKTW